MALSAIYRQLGLERDHALMMRLWKRAQARFCPLDERGLPKRAETVPQSAESEVHSGAPS